MSTKDFHHAQRIIVGAIRRGRGAFELVRSPRGILGEFVLLTGSHKALDADGAHVVALTLTRAQIAELRDNCNELLGD